MEIYVLKVSDVMCEFSREQLNEMLPEFRKNAYQKYQKPEDQDRSLVAGVLLSFCMNQKGVSLRETPSFNEAGKMYFPQVDRFYVNLSHGGDYAVCAWDTEDIGIDVEPIRKCRDGVVRRMCTADEMVTFMFLKDEEERDRTFTRIWTGKESVAKLYGEGIAMLFHGEQLQELCEQEGVCTHTYTSIPDYFISVSSRKSEFPEEIIVLSPESLKQLHQQSH